MKLNDQQSASSPFKSSQSRTSSQLSKIDLRQSALDSKRMIASQYGQPFLETISSNESRYTSSPNFLQRTNNLSQHIVTIPQQKFNQMESMSYSASSEFGQHSLRSSVENPQLSGRQIIFADQIKLDQYQLKNQNQIILEESKEEDISFNKTLAEQSPIALKTGLAGYYDNKSSIDDGTRSLIHQMRGLSNSRENSQTLGSQVFKNVSPLGGIAGMAKPNFNISHGSNQSPLQKFVGSNNNPRSSTQVLNQRSQIQDDELLEELTKVNGNNNENQSSQKQQLFSSLEVSEEGGFSDSQALGASHLLQSTLQRSKLPQQNQRNDLIRIDDNQFVTLSQVPEENNYALPDQNRQYNQYQNYSGRPSTLSNYFNQPIRGGEFSDGNSSSNPTTNLGTPYQNYNQSRTVSPFYYGRRDNQSQASSQRCECCKGPLLSYRPTSGLSNIEQKNLNFDNNEPPGTPHLASDNDQSTKIISSMNQVQSEYKNTLCHECQAKILNRDNTTGQPTPSDLRVSHLLSSNTNGNHLQFKSQISSSNNDENMNLNSNLSSIHQQNPTHIKAGSSVFGQSELLYSQLTLSNHNNHGAFQPPLQVNLLQNNTDSSSNPLQQSSLHYLSKLSSEIGPSIKYQSEQLQTRYGINSQDNYKLALKSFVNRQFERNSKNEPLQYSRIFREKQTKRVFDQLQNIKSEYAKSYEELEAMHINFLMGKATQLQ